jgi:hypothetical protein
MHRNVQHHTFTAPPVLGCLSLHHMDSLTQHSTHLLHRRNCPK